MFYPNVFYDELLRTEDFFTFERIVVTDMRVLAANVLRLCIERFDQDIKQNLLKGWSIHERAKRTLIALVGEVAHKRTIQVPSHELGTIEGTNAHVGAARVKGQGRSWSRAGAEAMCLMRCL